MKLAGNYWELQVSKSTIKAFGFLVRLGQTYTYFNYELFNAGLRGDQLKDFAKSQF